MSDPEPELSESEPPEDLPLLAHRGYALFLASRFLATLATGCQVIVIATEVYDIARRTMSIGEASFTMGMIGLTEFLPLCALTVLAGETADRYNRRRILTICYCCEMLTAIALAIHSSMGGGLWQIFVVAAIFGCTRAFFQPTASAMAPMLVPLRLLPRVIATNALTFQVASILGPPLGGLLYGLSPRVGYIVSASLYAVSVLCIRLIRADTQPVVQPGVSRLTQIREGLGYVWKTKLVLGAISLDLFAVLLGGATGLLPVFARDVLHVSSVGFGVLRASPAIGAMLVALYLTNNPITSRAGPKMLWSVALFGLMTVLFACSRSLPLSVFALAVLGGADMVSVFTRQSLVQIATPDRMRGRVSAVSTLFIGASNELGEFESGVVARFLGPVNAVIFGGCGAMVVTAIWTWMFPSLRKADKLI